VTLLVAALATLVVGGLLALVASFASARLSSVLGAGSCVVGCALGAVYALGALRTGGGGSLTLSWEVPYGRLRIETDALSAFFLVPLFGLGALAAVYGAGYLKDKGHRLSIGVAWLAYS
jgi:NADH:ubiquinone oxidoreductase subunit 5 (subunit L)/multisubunit Na+/H+ antiporter MnhA subunit